MARVTNSATTVKELRRLLELCPADAQIGFGLFETGVTVTYDDAHQQVELSRPIEKLDPSRFVPPCTCRPIDIGGGRIIIGGEDDCPVHGFGP